MRGITIVLATALCSAPAAAQLRHGAIVLPVGSCISSPFGPRVLSNHPQAGTYHNGVDLPAPEGTPVRAVASGKLLRIQHSGPGGFGSVDPTRWFRRGLQSSRHGRSDIRKVHGHGWRDSRSRRAYWR
jgi:murein DD-endopeptidase MepM/ murein hydrolase activator NlpD